MSNEVQSAYERGLIDGQGFPNWIPVEEKEPPMGVWLIVSTDHHVMMAKRYTQVHRDGRESVVWRSSYGGVSNIRAWMRAPEVYRRNDGQA